MAKSLPNTTVTPPTPVAKTHTAILQAQQAFATRIGRITKAQDAVGEATGALKGAQDAQGGVRQAILCELALDAIAGNVSAEHAKAGIDAAIAAYEAAANDKDAAKKTAGTLRQFAAECLRAMHPKAREHVTEAFEEAERLWDAEGERIEAARDAAKAAGKKFNRDSVETPLRDTFKRKWHMVAGSTGMLAARASEDAGKASLAEAPEMLADAVMRDERTDAKRAAKAIKRVVEAIQEIAAEFPSPRFDTVIDYLSALKPETLAAYRAKEVRAASHPTSSKPARKAQPGDVDDAADALLDA